MIALGVLAAVWFSQRRWAARGGNPEQISRLALWAVPAGLIGARLYHVTTEWRRFQSDGWTDALAIWKGGLGIPGGMAAGVLVGLWMVGRQRMNRGEAMLPWCPLCRWLRPLDVSATGSTRSCSGSPTDLPWGLEIDEAHRPAQYLDVETFHPTFLYEAVWNLLLCALLVHLDRRRIRRSMPTLVTDPRRVSRPGSLLAVYACGYGLGRLWIEAVRIDPASLVWGVRVNIWMSLVLVAGSALYLQLSRHRRSGRKGPVLPM